MKMNERQKKDIANAGTLMGMFKYISVTSMWLMSKLKFLHLYSTLFLSICSLEKRNDIDPLRIEIISFLKMACF